MFQKSIKKRKYKRHPVIALLGGLAMFALMYGLFSQMFIQNLSMRPAYLSFIFFLSVSTGGITTGTIYYYFSSTITEYEQVNSEKRRLI